MDTRKQFTNLLLKRLSISVYYSINLLYTHKSKRSVKRVIHIIIEKVAVFSFY